MHADKYMANTHEVTNQPPRLQNYPSFRADSALYEALRAHCSAAELTELDRFGQACTMPERIQLGFDANAYKPTLMTHDRYGERVDQIDFHPSYHQLMQIACEHGLHASPWRQPANNAHLFRMAKYYLHTQVEAAHGCPITMTFASLPALRHSPRLMDAFTAKITALAYDPSNRPFFEKSSLTVGMAMTEKQGGSDVRGNSTLAEYQGKDEFGEQYVLVGHKWFVSAPMCDLFLVLAQAPKGITCFLVPRWRPDGSKNPLQIQQLKNKMGNVANASSECELRGALGWRVGEEGRGIRTIIEMVAMTRYDCMIGSSAGMRQATVQAIHHARHRHAFGSVLSEQPLMQNVLADLALESEAALALTLRVARAMDMASNPYEQLLARLATPVGKYWICKRTPQHAYEAMEVIGGMGVMENTIMPRLFRESPVNAIWEGSGNVQCLDILRALHQSPDAIEVLRQELARSRGENSHYDKWLARTEQLLAQCDDPAMTYRARYLGDTLALALQANQLLQTSPNQVADAFCVARLSSEGAHHYGALPTGIPTRYLIERALVI